MSTLVGQTVAFLVSLAAFAFLLDGCLRLLLPRSPSYQARESRNRLDDQQTALRALKPRDASFSRRGSLPTIR